MNKDRINRLCEKIKTAGISAMLVCPSEEMRFLTGFSPMMCERFQGLFLTADGRMFYVCNLLYRGEIEHHFGDTMEILHWRDGHSMTDVVKAALEQHGLVGTTLGVNSTAQAFNVMDIAGSCGVSFVNGTGVLEEARIVKTPQELADLKKAAQIADQTYSKAIQWIKPGITEADILEFLTAEMVAAGGQNPWGIVASGPNSSFPHYHGTSRTIEVKDVMILDFGCTYNGLYSDMSRTLFVGGITDEERKIYELVKRSNAAGEAAAVNGAFIPDVDKAARDIIDAAGYGETFLTRLGHGIGYMMHEAPDIKQNNRRNLIPGMAFSIEPGIYLSGRLGMRIEDIVVVTEDGNEILNQSTKDLVII